MRPPPFRIRRSLPAVAALLCVAAAGACARVPAAKMSFADAGLWPDRGESATRGAAAAGELEGDGPPPAPPVAIPAPESIASEAPEGPPVDATLLRFASQARSRRSRSPAGRGFPAEAVAAWDALCADLDLYAGRALPQTPLLELLRARVTVEAEWDYDLRRYGAPPPELRARVEARASRLALRIQASRALGGGLLARAAPARLRWPLEGAGISSPYGMRAHPLDGRRRMHLGLDLASGTGRVVGAAAKGWVVRTGWMGGYGLVVEVRHGGDLTTRYGHLSAILCSPGDEVGPGHPLGLVGSTGRATGPHLHFEVWRSGEPGDPLAWLAAGAPAGAGN